MAQRKPFLLRMDPRLLAELEAWAAADLRSLNGQIEYLLREALIRRKGAQTSPAREAPPPSLHEKRRGS